MSDRAIRADDDEFGVFGRIWHDGEFAHSVHGDDCPNSNHPPYHDEAQCTWAYCAKKRVVGKDGDGGELNGNEEIRGHGGVSLVISEFGAIHD